MLNTHVTTINNDQPAEALWANGAKQFAMKRKSPMVWPSQGSNSSRSRSGGGARNSNCSWRQRWPRWRPSMHGGWRLARVSVIEVGSEEGCCERPASRRSLCPTWHTQKSEPNPQARQHCHCHRHCSTLDIGHGTNIKHADHHVLCNSPTILQHWKKYFKSTFNKEFSHPPPAPPLFTGLVDQYHNQLDRSPSRRWRMERPLDLMASLSKCGSYLDTEVLKSSPGCSIRSTSIYTTMDISRNVLENHDMIFLSYIAHPYISSFVTYRVFLCCCWLRLTN